MNVKLAKLVVKVLGMIIVKEEWLKVSLRRNFFFFLKHL